MPPGWTAKARTLCGAPRLIEADGEECVGGLGAAVGHPLVVFGALEVRIFEIGRADAVADRTERNHARAVGGLQRGPETRGELEVAEMVGGELRFVAARVAHQGRGHDGGVVDEDVELLGAREETAGESVDALGIGEIERGLFDIGDADERLLRFVRRARGDDDDGAGAGERFRGFETEAGIAAGDDGDFAGEIAPAAASRASVRMP